MSTHIFYGPHHALLLTHPNVSGRVVHQTKLLSHLILMIIRTSAIISFSAIHVILIVALHLLVASCRFKHVRNIRSRHA